jgi:hypothetical protein
MARYHNSTFTIRSDAKRLRSTKPMKRTQMKRVPGTARLERTPLTRSRKPINKKGRRTADWIRAWRFLKAELEKRGRTSCEFKFIPHECWGPLDPAHSKKRRNMKGNDIYMVALGCRAIHNFLDLQCTHEQMELFVLHAIDLAGGPILPEQKKAA